MDTLDIDTMYLLEPFSIIIFISPSMELTLDSFIGLKGNEKRDNQLNLPFST